MRNILLLLAAAGCSSAAFAQEVESVDTVNITKDYAAVKAGTVLAKTDNVTMAVAYDDEYKTVALTAEADAVNQIVIDGKTYDLPKGVQGKTNPSGTLSAPQTSGAVFSFSVNTDGYLYVFSKLTYNKSYYVWEGTGSNRNSKDPMVAYAIAAFDPSTGEKYAATLPSDEDGLFASEGKFLAPEDEAKAYTSTSWSRDYVKLDGTNKTTWEEYESDATVKEKVDAYLEEKGLTLCAKDADGADANLCTKITNNGTAIATAAGIIAAANGGQCNWTTGNASGVVAFSVIAGNTYYFNATGSKVTCGGFLFIPGATELASISGAKGAETPETAIKEISISDLDADAPVYNIQGQRVGKNFKGVCIQGGKKFIVK